MLESFTRATFSEHLDDFFHVCLEDSETIQLELIETTELSAEPRGKSQQSSKRIPFSILFRGAAENPLPQKIHTFEHPKMGRFELFIVPVGLDETGMLYEAVFT